MLQSDITSIRALILEKQEYFQQKVTQFVHEAKIQLDTVLENMRRVEARHPNYLHFVRMYQDQADELRRRIERAQRREEERVYFSRLHLIVRTAAAAASQHMRSMKDRYLLRFFGDTTKAMQLPVDACIHCGNRCLLLRPLGRLVCMQQGHLRPVVTNIASPNAIEMRHEASYMAKKHAAAAANGGQALKREPEGPLQALYRHEHVRMKWLYKQLLQYRAGTKRIPKEVIFAVCRRLRSIHLKSPSSVKHTITRSILQQLGYRDYISQASKIADICNGTPVACFNDAQFLCIFERLAAVQEVFLSLKQQANGPSVDFPNKDFLLKQFCILEKWPAQQDCFPHSKTFEVYQAQIAEWRIFLPLLQRSDTAHNWIYPSETHALDALRLV